VLAYVWWARDSSTRSEWRWAQALVNPSASPKIPELPGKYWEIGQMLTRTQTQVCGSRPRLRPLGVKSPVPPSGEFARGCRNLQGSSATGSALEPLHAPSR